MKKIIVCLVAISLCGCYQGMKSPTVSGDDEHEYIITVKADRVHAWNCEKCRKDRKAEVEHIVDSILKERMER